MRGTWNDHLPCAINAAIDAHSEREHMSTGEPVSIPDNWDDIHPSRARMKSWKELGKQAKIKEMME